MVSKILPLFAHLVLLVILPPFFPGVIHKTKAFFAGRKGPPILQGYYDLAKLLRKETVYSRSASVVVRFAPVGILLSIFAAALLIPLAGPAPIRFEGDLILFIYLLVFARFLTILMALDVGSSFEGMGASRDATFGAFAELGFFLGLALLAVIKNSLSLSVILQGEATAGLFEPALFLLFLTFFFTLLTENCRIPVDDPNTHLELTMIHEVMILDAGGPDLGLLLYGSSLKLFLFMVLTSSILWPIGPFGLPALGFLFLKGVGMSIAIGVIESSNARLRLMKVPQLLIANFVVTALAFLVILLGRSAS